MMRECIIHVGWGKTGSSSIQKTLFKLKDDLDNISVLYPGKNYNHNEIYFYFQRHFKHNKNRNKDPSNPEVYLQYKNSADLFVKEVFEKQPAKIIISHEGLHNLNREDLSEFRTWLLSFCDKVSLVCYLRPPVLQVNSLAQQKIKRGKVSYNDFQREVVKLPYRLHIENIIDVFGKDAITLRKFSRDVLTNGDVVYDFFSIVGLPEVLLSKRRLSFNESISMEAALVASDLIEGNQGAVTSISKDTIGLEGSKFSLPNEFLMKIKEKNKLDTEWLYKNFDLDIRDP